MRRYYISNAAIQDTAEGRELVPAIRAHGVNYVAWAPTPGGVLKMPWVLCLVEAPDHTALRADPALVPLPDLTMDSTLSALSTRAYNDLMKALEARGVTHTLTRQSTVRQLLQQVSAMLGPGFDENRFDVSV